MINQDLIEAIENHLSMFVDEDEIEVFADQISNQHPVDIYWIKPNKKIRPYSILMSCGMSAYPMDMPEGLEDKELAEVALLLPPDWNLDGDDWLEPENSWPLDHLTDIARQPFETVSWLAFGDTVKNEEDSDKCFAGTNFNSSILLNSITLPAEFTKINFRNATINVYTVIPLYPEELKFKMKNNADALIDKFIDFDINEILDPKRKNTCA